VYLRKGLESTNSLEGFVHSFEIRFHGAGGEIDNAGPDVCDDFLGIVESEAGC